MSVFQMTGGAVNLDGKPILRGIDLTVSEGEAVAVLGPNGSGKSTMIRALLGLIPLSAGRTTIFGVSAARFRDWHRVGYVPQRMSVGGGVPATVREIVSSGRIARRRPFRPLSRADRSAVNAALDAVGLSGAARAAVQTLSGGQQQRVLIARALAGEPDVLVMDEPAAGVDAENQAALARVLAGRTAVIVAHDLGPLESVIGRVVSLSARDHSAAEVVAA